MNPDEQRIALAGLLENPHIALPIEGGFSKSSNFLAGESIFRVMSDLDDPNFDSISAFIALSFLDRSKFSTTNCGIEGFELRIRTPGLLRVKIEESGNSVAYETHRCHSEKLYEILLRTKGRSSIGDIIDETETIVNGNLYPRIRLNRSYGLREIMNHRRRAAIIFYNYMTEVFKEIEIDVKTPGMKFKRNGFDYLREKREKIIRSSDFYKRYKRFFDEKEDFISLELLVNLAMFEDRSAEPGGSKIIREKLSKSLTELAPLTAVTLEEDDLVTLHDDNNKNVLVGIDAYDKLVLYFIDFHRLHVGNEIENWYSQIVYPGQYTFMPNELEQLPSKRKEKELEKRVKGVIYQVDDYIAERFGKKIQGDDLKALKVKTYAILTRWALRDSAIFYSFGQEELSNGFMQYAIEFAAMLHNTDKSYLPSLLDHARELHFRLFSPSRKYKPTDRII